MKVQYSVILFVEDNMAHAELVLRTIEDKWSASRVHHVQDGEAALDYLYQREAYSDYENCPRPHLILLDLRLPRIDGLEVLREIKHCDKLKSIPVVILSTSQSEADVKRAYDYRANSYLVKPLDFTAFDKMMNQLGSYWLRCNYFPW